MTRQRLRMAVAVAIAAMGVAWIPAAGGSQSATTNLRARLTAGEVTPPAAVKVRRATGLFVAKLKGQTLSWRLTFNGLSGAASAAHLHLGSRGSAGPVALRLCNPCRSGRTGKAILGDATLAAVKRRPAYVDLHTRKNPRGEIRGQLARGIVPALQILAPKDGETITPPTEVRYAVTGLELGPDAGRIVAFVRGVVDPVHVELGLTSQAGVAMLPAHKLLTGQRDLVFALARADGTLLQNPEARQTVYGLTILGGRGG